MILIELLFWTCLFILFYNYLGYGILLVGLVKLKRLFGKKTPPVEASFEPEVTLVIAAYNEEAFIEEKIRNSLALDYPENKLKIAIIADGSSDRTPELVKKYEQVQLLYQPERRGKTAALNRAMHWVDTPVVVFNDANTYLNNQAIRNIVRHFANPEVGGVAGEKKIMLSESEKAAGAGEGMYWKYESFLKKMDSELYSVVGAAGELFAIRSELYEEVEEDTILDDFIISLRTCAKGYTVKYEPEAYAQEDPSDSIKEEQKRKVRISAGGFQSIVRLAGLLNIFKTPLLSFQYISHRVLRWTLSPLSLLLVLVTNLLLLNQHWIYLVTLAGQLAFHSTASIGWVLANRNIKINALYIPYYFLFMNISVYQGFFRYLKGQQSAVWEKANRKSSQVGSQMAG
ncbi:glycosyltransferase family 2 protein [Rapidithrix thailandica]|uniref:Glycosyltransferase family 2 protein n=1 Tax=Rapidithrix thailandica TaxID=413964 RepID=A0AAW9SF04_9BACT